MSKIIQFRIEAIDNDYFTLMRLHDDECYEYRKQAIPILFHSMLLFRLDRARKKESHLNLAEFYVALKMLTGESGKRFDDWKSSFEFSFLMKIGKEEGEFEYMVRVGDYRGSMEFIFYRCVEPESSLKRNVYHEPFDDEFSAKEMDEFILFFYGYLRGYLNVVQEHYDEPFLNTIQSNHVQFGYLNGKFFQEYYEDSDEYEAAVKTKTEEFEKEIHQKGGMSEKEETIKLVLNIPADFRYLPYQEQVNIKKRLMKIVKSHLPSKS